MYKQHFGLSQSPFSIAPNPRFLYMSPQHSEALAHLLYGVRTGDGFVQLTGEVGTGKTTLCRGLIEQLPGEVDVALILNPRITALELVASLCDELHIDYPKDTTSIKVLIDALNAYLLDAHARGRRTVLIVDEAQCLGVEALEQVRLLTNLETTSAKLLQIILVGQPELRDLLARDNLRQLAQRITARYHLAPISRHETAAYIRHRLQLAEAHSDVFEQRAIELIHDLTRGVPRLINVLCDRAMLGAYTEGRHQVDRRIVRKAATEVIAQRQDQKDGGRRWTRRLALALPALVIATTATWLLLGSIDRRTAPVANQVNAGQLQQEPVETAAVPVQPAAADRAPAASVDAKAVVAVADDATVQEQPPPVPEPSPSGPSLAQWLDELAAVGEPTGAWGRLYREWGYDSAADSERQACAQALQAGLGCLSGSGSFGLLGRLDRPAVLKLRAGNGRLLDVLLRRVDGDRVELVAAEQTVRVGKDEVEQHWYGNYVALWKLPPAGSRQLQLGMRGADVTWLREQVIDLGEDLPDSIGADVFDRPLAQAVASIQRRNGLHPDGVAGPRTLILLNSLVGSPDTPHLSRVSTDGME